MRTLAAIGLAGALATASVGATTQSAQAAWAPGSFVAGLLIGGAVVALLAHHHSPAFAGTRTFGYVQPVYPTATFGFAANNHVAWCQARYKTYNVVTNTFVGNDRRLHQCVVR
jgi:hypothetical protein